MIKIDVGNSTKTYRDSNNKIIIDFSDDIVLSSNQAFLNITFNNDLESYSKLALGRLLTPNATFGDSSSTILSTFVNPFIVTTPEYIGESSSTNIGVGYAIKPSGSIGESVTTKLSGTVNLYPSASMGESSTVRVGFQYNLTANGFLGYSSTTKLSDTIKLVCTSYEGYSSTTSVQRGVTLSAVGHLGFSGLSNLVKGTLLNLNLYDALQSNSRVIDSGQIVLQVNYEIGYKSRIYEELILNVKGQYNNFNLWYIDDNDFNYSSELSLSVGNALSVTFSEGFSSKIIDNLLYNYVGEASKSNLYLESLYPYYNSAVINLTNRIEINELKLTTEVYRAILAYSSTNVLSTSQSFKIAFNEGFGAYIHNEADIPIKVKIEPDSLESHTRLKTESALVALAYNDYNLNVRIVDLELFFKMGESLECILDKQCRMYDICVDYEYLDYQPSAVGNGWTYNFTFTDIGLPDYQGSHWNGWHYDTRVNTRVIEVEEQKECILEL